MKQVFFSLLLFAATSSAFASRQVEVQISELKTLNYSSFSKENISSLMRQRSVNFTLSCGIQGVMIWDDETWQPTPMDIVQNIQSLDEFYCGD